MSIENSVINSANIDNFSFTLSAAETGTVCHYSIDDTNGGTAAVIGSFSVSSAGQTQSGIDVSSLDDTVLTLTLYLTDVATNQGGDVTDSVIKDTLPPVAGGGGTVDTSNITYTSINLAWTEATDNVTAQANLNYKVVRSGSNNLNKNLKS